MDSVKTKKGNFNMKKKNEKAKNVKTLQKENNQPKPKKKNFWMKKNGGDGGAAKLSPSYYDAANILKQMYYKKGSLNSLISKCTHQKLIKMTYALAIKYLQNQRVLYKVHQKLMKKAESGHGYCEYLIKILLTDMLYGSAKFKSYRKNNEINFVLDNTDEIIKHHEALKNLKNDKTQQQNVLRFIRVNLNKANVAEVCEALQASGFKEVSYSKDNTSFKRFMTLAKKLEDDQYLRDYHFDDLLCFETDATKKVQELDIYKRCCIVMQDKASLIPIECMALKPGMSILESCAAPGMKTAAIASRLNNQCNLHANDYEKNRFVQMQKMLAKFGATATLTNADFLNINIDDYQDFDVIMVDPTCSGSGMVRRLDYEVDEEDETTRALEQERVKKLAKMQVDLLAKAASCQPKRLIYCTCSLNVEENEQVIANLLSGEHGENYEVIDPFPQWPIRGDGDADFKDKVFRSSPDTMLTQGFFCCVLQRKGEFIPKNEEAMAVDTNEEAPKKKKKRKRPNSKKEQE